MTHQFLLRIMKTSGITEHDFHKIIVDDSPKGVMTDQTVFSVSRYLNSVKGINVFLSRKVGNTEIRPKWSGNNVDFNLLNEDGSTLAVISLLLVNPFSFHIKYPAIQRDVAINLDLLDYDGERDPTMDLRMRVLNEILTRYYSRTLYTVYKELHKRG